MNELEKLEKLKTLTPYQAEAKDNHNTIKILLTTMQRKAIEVGYFLNEAQTHGYYRALGYNDIYEYAEQEFGLGKTNTKNYQALNRAFTDSYDNGKYKGYSLKIDIRYKEYNTSQLIEMLPMTPTDRRNITSDMKVSEIRDYKKVLESPSTIGLEEYAAESYAKIKADPMQAVKEYRKNKENGSLKRPAIKAETQSNEELTTVAEGQMIVGDDGEITEYHQTGALILGQTSDLEKENNEIDDTPTAQDVAQQKIKEILETADDVEPEEVFDVADEENEKVYVTDGKTPVLLQIEELEENILEYLERWRYKITSQWLSGEMAVENTDAAHFIACYIYRFYEDVFNGKKPEVKRMSRNISEEYEKLDKERKSVVL